jgi:hypothetical protein
MAVVEQSRSVAGRGAYVVSGHADSGDLIRAVRNVWTPVARAPRWSGPASSTSTRFFACASLYARIAPTMPEPTMTTS